MEFRVKTNEAKRVDRHASLLLSLSLSPRLSLSPLPADEMASDL